MLHSEVTGHAIGSFHVVYKDLGFGFLENVYSNAMAVELRFRGLDVVREVPSEVVYRGVPVASIVQI